MLWMTATVSWAMHLLGVMSNTAAVDTGAAASSLCCSMKSALLQTPQPHAKGPACWRSALGPCKLTYHGLSALPSCKCPALASYVWQAVYYVQALAGLRCRGPSVVGLYSKHILTHAACFIQVVWLIIEHVAHCSTHHRVSSLRLRHLLCKQAPYTAQGGPGYR